MTHTAPATPPAITLRPTTADDLEFVVSLERAPRVAAFVTEWPPEWHAAAIDDLNQEHLVIERAGVPSGYAILALHPDPLDGVPFGAVDLVRLATSPPREGIGAAALEAVAERAFGTLAAPALTLDVLDHNDAALRLYTRHGFVAVGSPVSLKGQPGRVMVRLPEWSGR